MTTSPGERARLPDSRSTVLPDGATVAVVGGGPAGAFFAIRAARNARALGKALDIVIIEKNTGGRDSCPAHALEGCNYCAGGISPNLFDILNRDGIHLPEEIIEGKAEAVIVHGDWKSLELPVPKGRTMLSVFRGTRPQNRPSRYENFDAFLLQQAVREGARLICGEALDISYAAGGRPVVRYGDPFRPGGEAKTIEADFVAVASGVNQTPGMNLAKDRFLGALKRVLPGFTPPKVRRALICEMQADEEAVRPLETEVHFVQYGSRDLRIEMSSLIPKGRWITIVLLGPSVDAAQPSDRLAIIERFLELPHIKRLIPKGAALRPACLCFPNMTVKRARRFLGDRIALVGDIVVSRLYKDGIFSAYTTAEALSSCILNKGISRTALMKGYAPFIRRFDRDNRFGEVVFALSRLTFSRPVLSRIVYQAVLTELKSRALEKRRLANVLWKIAGGDDSYRKILKAMAHPAAIWTIFWGGALVTFRNALTERLFGLRWEGIGRYQTGVAKEDFEEKRQSLLRALELSSLQMPEFSRMYSIRIKADRARVLREIGKFGVGNNGFFSARRVAVRRISGAANELGSTVLYDVSPRFLSFRMSLERIAGTRFFMYRVLDGFARNGIFVFGIDPIGGDSCTLSIYVAFDFPRGANVLQRSCWRLFRLFFPGFVHDVIWNQSLCRLKHLVEANPEVMEE
jgi:flavin-dependent dehydrogenase